MDRKRRISEVNGIEQTRAKNETDVTLIKTECKGDANDLYMAVDTDETITNSESKTSDPDIAADRVASEGHSGNRINQNEGEDGKSEKIKYEMN